MKLRNKKTGEIATVEGFGSAEGEIQMTYTIDNDETKLYLYCTPSLTTFNEDWEDYEEPKGTYFINTQGDVQFWDSSSFAYPDDWSKEKQIGNYFETKEEAEKAVEKLKAWKRLKDDGITYSLDEGNGTPYIIIHSKEEKGPVQKVLRILEDLTLLFGGEE